jgi:hypothetical protein
MTDQRRLTSRVLAGCAMEWSGRRFESRSGQNGFVFRRCEVGEVANRFDRDHARRLDRLRSCGGSFPEVQGRFLWPSWRDGNMHLYLYSFDQQNPMAATQSWSGNSHTGDFEVLGIEGVDESAGTVFFQANPDDPRQQHIYSVKLDGTGLAAAHARRRECHFRRLLRGRQALRADIYGPADRAAHLAVRGGRRMCSGVAGARRSGGVWTAGSEVSGVQGGGWHDALRAIYCFLRSRRQRQDSADR